MHTGCFVSELKLSWITWERKIVADKTWGSKLEEDVSVELLLVCQCIRRHGNSIRVSDGGQLCLQIRNCLINTLWQTLGRTGRQNHRMMPADSLNEAKNVGLARTGTYAYSATTKLARFLHGDEAESCHGDIWICAAHITLHKQARVFIGILFTEYQFLLDKYAINFKQIHTIISPWYILPTSLKQPSGCWVRRIRNFTASQIMLLGTATRLLAIAKTLAT